MRGGERAEANWSCQLRGAGAECGGPGGGSDVLYAGAGGSLDARSWVHPVESNTAVWSAKLKRGFGAAWRLLNASCSYGFSTRAA
eukprot:scaffold65337_cov63-Phaeocystis_antarctica.AAC.2